MRLAGLTFRIDLPGTGAESEVFATIVGYDELLAEVKLGAVRIMRFAFALPDSDEGEQAQEGIVKRWPLAQDSGVRIWVSIRELEGGNVLASCIFPRVRSEVNCIIAAEAAIAVGISSKCVGGGIWNIL